jgi:hypothetical protein
MTSTLRTKSRRCHHLEIGLVRPAFGCLVSIAMVHSQCQPSIFTKHFAIKRSRIHSISASDFLGFRASFDRVLVSPSITYYSLHLPAPRELTCRQCRGATSSRTPPISISGAAVMPKRNQTARGRHEVSIDNQNPLASIMNAAVARRMYMHGANKAESVRSAPWAPWGSKQVK